MLPARALCVSTSSISHSTRRNFLVKRKIIMIWRKKALILTVILFLLDGGFAITMFHHIQNTAPNLASESIRHEKLGSNCGLILSLGTSIIWIGAFLNKRS